MVWELRFSRCSRLRRFLIQWIFKFGIPPLRESSAFDGALHLCLRLQHRRAFRAVTTRLGFLSAPAMAPGERLPLVQDLPAAPGGIRRRPVDYFKVLLHFRLRSRLHEKPPRVVQSPFLGGGLSVLQILVTSCAHVCSFDEAMASLSSLF